MNTPTRRAVFVALMGSEDAQSAVERLLRLALRGPSEREIVRVLIDCAAQEAAYNPFYAAVGVRLCSLYPRFRFTFQLAFWDTFKSFSGEAAGGGRRGLEEEEEEEEEEGGGGGSSRLSSSRASSASLVTPRRLYNLARLLSSLTLRGACTLAVLKPLSFTSQERSCELFLKALFCSMLTEAPSPGEVAVAFTRLGSGPDRVLLRDGIAIFLHQHVPVKSLQAFSAQVPRAQALAQQQAEAGSLSERLKAAKRALEAVAATAVDVDDLLAR
jgi:nucleolar MIF4G domain-containing protein 1